MRRSLSSPNALTENQIRHATLMLTRAYDNGTLLLFEVTNNVIKQFIRFNICQLVKDSFVDVARCIRARI